MLTESTNNLTYQKLSKEEMEQRGILGRLVGVCADFSAPTRNGRKYPEKLWENIFNSDIMKERIANGVCFGELGHPPDREETDMEKICICMPEEPKKGPDGKLRAVFDILDTPNGRILKSLCDYGSTLGISSRGSGDLEVDFDGQESVNPDTYNCEGFDIVLLPGVKDARLQYVNESLDKKRYNKTLRQRIKESVDNETEDHKKAMLESLNTLGIELDESMYRGTNIVENEDGNYDIIVNDIVVDGNFKDRKSAKVAVDKELEMWPDEPWGGEPLEEKLKANYKGYEIKPSKDDTYEVYDKEGNKIFGKLADIASARKKIDKGAKLHADFAFAEDLDTERLDEGLTPQEKMDAWHNGTRRENIKACGDEKLARYWEICMKSGYQEEADKLEAELNRRGLYVEDMCDMESINQSKSVDNEVNSSLHPKFKFDSKRQELYILADIDGVEFLKQFTDNPWEAFPHSADFSLSTDVTKTWFIVSSFAPRGQEIAQAAVEIIQEKGLRESIAEAYGIEEEEPKARDSKDTDYIRMSRMYQKSASFDSIDSGELRDVIEYLDEHGMEYDIYNNKKDNGCTIFYDGTISIIEEVQTADDNDMAIVNELQEALKLNKQLDEKIIKLQEKLSASHAKEMKLEEAMDNYKVKVAELSNRNKENLALREKISKLEMDLKESANEATSKKKSLHETMQRDAKERMSLKEEISDKDKKIAQLNEELDKTKKSVAVRDKLLDESKEKLETLSKDNRQLKEQYSKKLEQNNELIEKYKKIAKSAVDKYIDKQATVLGVSSSEVKNRLPESYTFKDIDRVCEGLREYRVNMSSLPFNTSLNENVSLTAKNISNKTLVRNADDEISDTDMKLAERFIR